MEPGIDFRSSGEGPRRLGIAFRTHGDDGSDSYRIPGLARTPKGTLIAVYDIRRESYYDLSCDIDVGVSRSTDGGRTWEKIRIAMDMALQEPVCQASLLKIPAGVIHVSALSTRTLSVFCTKAAPPSLPSSLFASATSWAALSQTNRKRTYSSVVNSSMLFRCACLSDGPEWDAG